MLDTHVRVNVVNLLQLILVQYQDAHVLRNFGGLLRYFAQLLLGQVKHRFIVAFGGVWTVRKSKHMLRKATATKTHFTMAVQKRCVVEGGRTTDNIFIIQFSMHVQGNEIFTFISTCTFPYLTNSHSTHTHMHTHMTLTVHCCQWNGYKHTLLYALEFLSYECPCTTSQR